MGREAVGSMSGITPGMLKDLFRQIEDGSIKKEHLQAFLEHRNPFKTEDIIKDWEEFYREVFGIGVDFSEIKIPVKKRDSTGSLLLPIAYRSP